MVHHALIPDSPPPRYKDMYKVTSLHPPVSSAFLGLSVLHLSSWIFVLGIHISQLPYF